MLRNKALRLWQLMQRLFFLRDRPLTFKLLAFSALLVIVPLSLVGAISYRKSTGVLEEQASQSSWQIIEQVKSHIEYYIRDFEIDSIKMLNHPEMRKLLHMRTTEEALESGIRRPILQLLKDTAYSRSDISRITLILDGIVIIDTAEAESVFPAGQLRDEYWYPGVPMNGDIKLISRMLAWPKRTEPVISIVKRVFDPNTLEPCGMLIMYVNFKRIQEIADMVTVGRSGYLSIIDAEGRYMYHPDLEKLGQPALIPDLNGMLKRDHGYFQTDAGSFYTFSRSSYLNWQMVTTMPIGELRQGSAYIGRTILLTVIVTLIAAYLLAIGFAASVIGPLRRLQFFVKRVKEGDFAARVEVRSNDEIGCLTRDFNGMVEQLQVLMDEIYLSKLRESDLSLRQKETELKVLQSQINPHFLYNSLETVRGMALEKGVDSIASLVASLARLLRYNLNNASSVVTLREELAICGMYLKIQQFRFEDKLQYRFDVPDWALDDRIAKFSLQPLVENCVIHGLEPGMRSVLIDISASPGDDGSFTVRIRDTGVGIAPEKLAAIQRDLREKDVISGGTHIGIVNVHRRIAHLFGDRYGLRIESEPGRETSVCVILPLSGTSETRQQQGPEERGPHYVQRIAR